MATSLLHALLEDTHNFSEEEFNRMPETTKRLLRAELYEALMRDEIIMPLLVNLIKDNRDVASYQLFEALKNRIRENYQQIEQP